MWILPPQQRLSDWRNFRLSLDNLQLNDAVFAINDLWNTAPIASPFYTHDSPNLPGPWELLTENYYDDLGKALGIFYTFSLCNHSKIVSHSLSCYRNHHSHRDYNIVNIGNYILNKSIGIELNISSAQDDLGNLLRTFNKQDLIRLTGID